MIPNLFRWEYGFPKRTRLLLCTVAIGVVGMGLTHYLNEIHPALGLVTISSMILAPLTVLVHARDEKKTIAAWSTVAWIGGVAVVEVFGFQTGTAAWTAFETLAAAGMGLTAFAAVPLLLSQAYRKLGGSGGITSDKTPEERVLSEKEHEDFDNPLKETLATVKAVVTPHPSR